jgi:hypothetical protein
MAAKEDATRGLTADGGEGGFEALLVALGTAAGGWAVWAGLAKGQIAAKDGPSGIAERGSEGGEERCVRVRAGAVGEDEGITGGGGREMEETADGGLVGRIVVEFLDVAHM